MWRNFLNLPLGMVSMATEGSAVKEFSISRKYADAGYRISIHGVFVFYRDFKVFFFHSMALCGISIIYF